MDVSSSSVLIIDDNPEFAKSLNLLINEVAGSYVSSVDCVSNVLDGIRRIRNNHFQYVFINTDLPNLDGIMAIHLINMAKPEITIIASSFNKGLFYQFLVENAGASMYLANDEINSNTILDIFSDIRTLTKVPIVEGSEESFFKRKAI
jgi:CheY-like chemotaxis protein